MALFKRKAAPMPPPEERMTYEQLAKLAAASSSLVTYAGGSLTLDSALKSAAAWACITRLKSTITSLPVDVIRVQGDRRTVLPKAQHPAIVAQPSPSMSRRAWLGQAVHALTTSGFVAADVIDVDAQNRPVALETINTGRVSCPAGVWLVDGKPRQRWPFGDLWLITASHLMVDGSSVPLSPIVYGRESIATGLAAERYGADFFRAGGTPVAVLKPDPVGERTAEQAEAAKQAVVRATTNRGVLALSGWSLEPFSINPKDTQFVELLQFTLQDAARRWLVPPSMIFAAMTGQNVTYANVTDADLQYWKHGVQSWVVDLEDAWADMLPGNLVAKFNVDAVLRMDKRARTEEHKIRLETKTRTINEVRRLEDEDPFPDPIYDMPGIPDSAPDATAGDHTPPTDGGMA